MTSWGAMTAPRLLAELTSALGPRIIRPILSIDVLTPIVGVSEYKYFVRKYLYIFINFLAGLDCVN
jgi:hypothetical protein